MKKVIPTIALALLGILWVSALPAAAQSANAFRISAGIFEPDGESQYWRETFDTFSGSVSDFDDAEVSFEYMRRISRRLSVVAGVSTYEGVEDLGYLDFVDLQGFDILHEGALEIETATLGLRLDLASENSTLIPYVAIGGGFFGWTLTESGEFVDFGVIPEEIFASTFQDDGVTFGSYFAAGLEIPIGRSFAIFAEAKWTDAQDDLGGDFAGLGELDLSGRRIAGGFSWRF